jgi:NAD(P)-dependent dehydrogenase (short-subunit alcohol dehydrogenase family)
MSTENTADNPAKLEAVQAVVDRVSSWQDGATEGTVASELRKGATEVGIDLTEDEIEKLADAIESEHGAVDAAAVLG